MYLAASLVGSTSFVRGGVAVMVTGIVGHTYSFVYPTRFKTVQEFLRWASTANGGIFSLASCGIQSHAGRLSLSQQRTLLRRPTELQNST
jgi:hypothetical protein